MTDRKGEVRDVAAGGDIAALLLAALIHPIAWPGWLIEWFVSHWRPAWRFGRYSATPYFTVIAVVAGSAVAFSRPLIASIGIYFLTAIEVLALWICFVIAIGRRTQVSLRLKRYGRRSKSNPRTPFSSAALYIGVVSYGYTIFYFALLNCFLFRLRPSAFKGVVAATHFGAAWEFFYYSTVTITTLGYGDITPHDPFSQALTVAELIVGLFFVLFVFGAFVSFHVNRVGKES